MSPRSPLGVPNRSIEPRDHICALYRGVAERDQVLLPWTRAGLESGDKCLASEEMLAFWDAPRGPLLLHPHRRRPTYVSPDEFADLQE